MTTATLGEFCTSGVTSHTGARTITSQGPSSLSGNLDQFRCYWVAGATYTFEIGSAHIESGSGSGTWFKVLAGHDADGAAMVVGTTGQCSTYNAPADFTAFLYSSGELLCQYGGFGASPVFNLNGQIEYWYNTSDEIGSNSSWLPTYYSSRAIGQTAQITAAGASIKIPIVFRHHHMTIRG